MPRVRFLRDTKPDESGDRLFKAGEVVDDLSPAQVERWRRRAACVLLNDGDEVKATLPIETPGGWVEGFRAELLQRGENPQHVQVLCDSAEDEARRGKAEAEIRADVELALQNAKGGDTPGDEWEHDEESGAYSRGDHRIDPVLDDDDEIVSWTLAVDGERVGGEFDTLDEAKNAADTPADNSGD